MSIVDELEQKIDIVELVGKYTNLKKAGTNFKALCPFPGHSENTPSFVASPSKQLAYCFGCHKWGWPLKFIMDIENCEFKDAIEILGNITGTPVNTNYNPEKIQAQKNLYAVYKDAVQYYKDALKRNPEIKKYLMDRWIQSESFEKFHFGYADNGSALYSYLKEKGYDDEIISESALFLDIRSKKDKCINRIIFPIQNLRGDFVAIAGRTITKQEPKYLNSPATKVYDKSSILYGLYEARHTITKEDFVIITEGYMDTIALQQAGFHNTVAVSGTAFTEKHIQIIKRLTKKIYLCFDGDKAGEKATKLSLEAMKNQWIEVKIIHLPGWKDPDDIISSGKDFHDYISSALSPIGYMISRSDFNIESIEDKKKLLQELFSTIASYSDNIEKDTYLKEIALKLNIRQNVIYDSFNRVKNKTSKKTETPVSKKVSSEDLVIASMIHQPASIEILKKELLFQGKLSWNIAQILSKWVDFITGLELEQKNYYQALALKLEQEGEEQNETFW